MLAYRLRPAHADDAEALFRIHRAAMGEHLERAFGPWTEELARERHEEWLRSGRAQVVMVGDEIAGILDVQWQATRLRVLRIELAPAFQGRGLGSSILGDLMRQCAERRLPARLEVFPHNPARHLYRRLGFRETGVDGPSIVMQWDPPGAARD